MEVHGRAPIRCEPRRWRRPLGRCNLEQRGHGLQQKEEGQETQEKEDERGRERALRHSRLTLVRGDCQAGGATAGTEAASRAEGTRTEDKG